MRMLFFVLLLLQAGITISSAAAQTCSRQSPAHTVALLELYTSEGCSSCPPADRMLGNLQNHASTTDLDLEHVVPLSLHVDYWDYIGWKDRFAQAAFNRRQRWLSTLAASRTIYTPEFFVSGHELHGNLEQMKTAIRHINARPAQAHIQIVLGKTPQDHLAVTVNAQTAQDGKLFVALYENDLTNDIKAGENQGVRLHHDYVVREWIGPIMRMTDTNGSKLALSRTLILPVNAIPRNMGVAAFVQNDQGEVLQALALPVCEK
jgi:hypothetical protein